MTSLPSMFPPPRLRRQLTDEHPRLSRPPLLAVLIAAAFFLAVAPTLAWQEFSSGSENLLAQTVLEMRRGGPWLVPTLQEQIRTQKPPFPAWITAAAVRPDTVAALADSDDARRDAAYTQLAWQMRWPALLALCAMLPAVYGIGRIVGGSGLGLLAVLMCGSSVLFLRHAHYATTDVQLALWVTVANLAMMWALLEGRWWRGCATAGAALGLAMMSKGPVALVQSVLPMLVFAAWRAWSAWRMAREGLPPVFEPRGFPLDDVNVPLAQVVPASVAERGDVPGSAVANPIPFSRKLLAVLLGLVLMASIGLPWYAAVLLRYPSVGELWFKEVTREGATNLDASKWYAYASLFAFVMPWAVFFVAGLIGGTVALFARRGERVVLPLLLVAVPVLVMSLARDRKERYLLPMIGPAAVLAAWGLREVYTACRRGERPAQLAAAGNWFLLGLLAMALPLVAVLPGKYLQTREDEPWFGWNIAGPALVLAALGVTACVLLWYRGRPTLAVAATAAVVLGIHALGFHGYSRSAAGRSEMKPLADAIRDAKPDAVASYRYRRRVPGDLSIYLNKTVPQVQTFEEAVARADAVGGSPVVFMFHKAGTPDPVAPAGWTPLHAAARSEDGLVAFVPEEVRSQ